MGSSRSALQVIMMNDDMVLLCMLMPAWGLVTRMVVGAVASEAPRCTPSAGQGKKEWAC